MLIGQLVFRFTVNFFSNDAEHKRGLWTSEINVLGIINIFEIPSIQDSNRSNLQMALTFDSLTSFNMMWRL